MDWFLGVRLEQLGRLRKPGRLGIIVLHDHVAKKLLPVMFNTTDPKQSLFARHFSLKNTLLSALTGKY